MKFEVGKLYQITGKCLKEHERWVQYWCVPKYGLKDPNLPTNPIGERCVGRCIEDDKGLPVRRKALTGDMFMFLGSLPGSQYHTQDFRYMHMLVGESVFVWDAPVSVVLKRFEFKRLV